MYIMCLYVMCEKPFFVSFSAAQFPSLSRSFSILVCVACVRASAFTDTYFISKQDFSVCDLLRPLLAVHLGLCSRKNTLISN